MSDIDKTLAGAMRNALRSRRVSTESIEKSIRKRFQLRWAMRAALADVLGIAPQLSERLWAALGALFDGFWPLLASRGRPKIGFGAAFGCPKAVLSASGRVPATAFGAQIGPRSIFHRFGSIWGGFSSIFARAVCDENTKAESQKGVV